MIKTSPFLSFSSLREKRERWNVLNFEIWDSNLFRISDFEISIYQYPYISIISFFFFPSILYFSPILVNAAIALSRCSRSCPAEICTLMRACPFATTGNENPITYIPSSYRSRAISCASFALYSIIGTIGWMPSYMSNPAAVIFSLKYLVLFSNLSRRAVEPRSKSIALIAATITTGQTVFENR